MVGGAHHGAVPDVGARAVGGRLQEGGCLQASPLPQGPQGPHHLPGALPLLGWRPWQEPCLCPAGKCQVSDHILMIEHWQMPAQCAERLRFGMVQCIACHGVIYTMGLCTKIAWSLLCLVSQAFSYKIPSNSLVPVLQELSCACMMLLYACLKSPHSGWVYTGCVVNWRSNLVTVEEPAIGLTLSWFRDIEYLARLKTSGGRRFKSCRRSRQKGLHLQQGCRGRSSTVSAGYAPQKGRNSGGAPYTPSTPQ